MQPDLLVFGVEVILALAQANPIPAERALRTEIPPKPGQDCGNGIQKKEVDEDTPHHYGHYIEIFYYWHP